MWCRLSHSGHSTIKDVCPVLYSYCLHCGWAFHSAGKGVDTVILLDLRTPPVELKPWQLLPGSFCQVPSQNVNTPRWINKGEIIFFLISSSEWGLCTSNVFRISRWWRAREEDMAPAEDLLLHLHVVLSSCSGLQMTKTISQKQAAGLEWSRV